MREKSLRKKVLVSLGLYVALAAGAAGCKKGAEIAVPHVESEELPGSSQTGEEKEAELGLATEPGTVLGEEEVVLMLEGEAERMVYTRIQGSGDYSIAYDPERFTVTATKEEVRFEICSQIPGNTVPVFVSVKEVEGASSEELADAYVAESNEECTVEEVTIGEGEYPAIWISYAEGIDSDSRTCDLYILRHNEKLYVVQMDCFVEAYEGLGEVQQMILSTLRFHEG